MFLNGTLHDGTLENGTALQNDTYMLLQKTVVGHYGMLHKSSL